MEAIVETSGETAAEVHIVVMDDVITENDVTMETAAECNTNMEISANDSAVANDDRVSLEEYSLDDTADAEGDVADVTDVADAEGDASDAPDEYNCGICTKFVTNISNGCDNCGEVICGDCMVNGAVDFWGSPIPNTCNLCHARLCSDCMVVCGHCPNTVPICGYCISPHEFDMKCTPHRWWTCRLHHNDPCGICSRDEQ